MSIIKELIKWSGGCIDSRIAKGIYEKARKKRRNKKELRSSRHKEKKNNSNQRPNGSETASPIIEGYASEFRFPQMIKQEIVVFPQESLDESSIK